MKFNLTTVLTSGAAALAGLSLGLVLSVNPLAVNAQMPEGPLPGPEILEQVNLTPQQRDQLDQIRQNTRTQVEGLLTPEQQQQFRNTLEEGRGFREAIATMNLSADQRSQLRSIFQNSRQQASAVLTPDQRQQLRDAACSRASERLQ